MQIQTTMKRILNIARLTTATATRHAVRRAGRALLLLLLPINAYAQGGYVCGEVTDAYLQEGLPNVVAELLRADSSVVAADTSRYQIIERTDVRGVYSKDIDRYSGATFKIPAPSEGKYILRLSLEGYETKCVDIVAQFSRRTLKSDAGSFVMFPRRKDTELGLATVTTTRIQMYHKGDTLIYNADAFNTPEGSMLDELVRRLPGVEFRDGRLYAQGKFVENILISGKDFFNGDPNAALQNLPAYVVSKLKFYDKAGEMSETMERDMHDKSYVMDVHLKRDYQGVWMVNPSVGYGTNDRYQGLLFVMRFDERQNFFLSADINNLGQEREATEVGTGIEAYQNRRMTNKFVRGSYSIYPSSKFSFSATAGYKHQSFRTDEETDTETYLADGNLFTRERSRQKTGLTNLEGDVQASWRPRKGRYFKWDYSVNFTRQTLNSLDRAARFTANPEDYMAEGALDSVFAGEVPAAIAPLLAYRLQQEQQSNTHNLRQKAQTEMHFAVGDNLLKLSFGWNGRRATTERTQHYDLRYAADNAGEDDYRNRYYDVTDKNNDYAAAAEFFRKYIDTDRRNGQFTLAYDYDHRRESDLNLLYSLEQLADWGLDSDRPLGMLPAADVLLSCLNAEDSYDRTVRRRRHTLTAKWLHEWQMADSTWMKLDASLPLSYSSRTMSYWRNSASYPVSTRSFLTEPRFSWTYAPVPNDKNGRRALWQLEYAMRTNEPAIYYFATLRDAADPLNISIGNPDLENEQTHNLALSYRHNNLERQREVGTRLEYRAVRNALAMNSAYDTQTGVRTYQPTTVNGNYQLGAEVSFSAPLNKTRTLRFNTRTQGRYSESANLNTTAQDDPTAARTETRAVIVSETLGLTLTPSSKLRLSASVDGSWNRIYSTDQSFTTLNVFNVTYKAGLTASLPWQLEFDTYINWRTRYGYSNDANNGSNVMWNAELSRPLLPNKLYVSLQANDILHNKRRVNMETNSWGRVEYYSHLTTPAYIMLNLTYRLSFTD